MSFYEYKDYIEEGDLVLAFISRGLLKPFTVTKGELLNTRFGNFEHDRMVGMKYGSQMGGVKDKGFVHLMHPTPELWTVSLPHRTQIVYTPDSSYIMQRLGVQSGSRVIEAGTGSASFTHAFARTVADEGKVYTYEFHEPRFLEAKRELDQHGLLSRNCVITHRDVCNDGFDLEGFSAADLACDTVFLDLPSPWTAIPHLKSVVASDRRVGICCFSPCIEQVDKTIEALEKNEWTDIEMVEIAGRRWEARKEMDRDVNDVIKRLKHIQGRKSQGIESRRQVKVSENGPTQTGKRDSSDADLESTLPDPQDGLDAELPSYNPFGKGLRIREGDEQFNWKQVTKIESEVKTHTSYLTFAYLVPTKKRESIA